LTPFCSFFAEDSQPIYPQYLMPWSPSFDTVFVVAAGAMNIMDIVAEMHDSGIMHFRMLSYYYFLYAVQYITYHHKIPRVGLYIYIAQAVVDHNNIPAIPAVCNVEINPQIIADEATRTIVLACEGANAPSTPIWIPSELRLAKPQSEYEAMLNALGLRGSLLFIIACSSMFQISC
jgi:hypothetical protein